MSTNVLVLRQRWIDGWPGLEGASPKPRGFLRSAQSSPGHPIHQRKSGSALVAIQEFQFMDSLTHTALELAVRNTCSAQRAKRSCLP